MILESLEPEPLKAGRAVSTTLELAGLPALFTPTPAAAQRTLEFFTANIRNPNTRKAYARAVAGFATWCGEHGLQDLASIGPVHVAAYVEQLQARLSAPSVKQHLAALRVLFDWLVVGQVIPLNPASSVRGPRHSVRKGKTPVLTAEEARAMLDAIDITTPTGLRDRALIALMVYTFARVGAAIGMKVEDVYVQGRRTWVRLHEKGGKVHEMPCHHHLDEYVHAYLNGAGLGEEKKAFLFRSAKGRGGGLSALPMSQADVYRMIGRRAAAASVDTKIGCHSFRATGITEYLRNGGKLEVAQQMANHESARTTGLYDRRQDQVSLDEVERIRI
ncbi:tyrosine-type recombinase/integrase [Variovorax sp. J22P271]|uniref:tyrosine-type recombinase/integrase n=1 Tax=Variovorax davisae TaxID=3053515 RepID=UPI002578C125|nr:tyrosine-type recombinase/integrase [Variovorax sp. J22P271]MDM0037334.1 tyrosine-type recombinase/integrase [Variovorax sp. J22P271]